MQSSKEALRNFWYPVALSVDVGDKPVPATLLDEQIVLWRSNAGVSAFRDLCMHRGTRLSIGWIDDNKLVCPYHGWTYACTGAVVKIPSVPPERPIPAKAHAIKYHCKERYGLVFVCLGEPQFDVYDVPEFEDAAFKTHIVGPIRWRANATRSFENFFDEAHLPWAHPGLLGNRDQAPVIPNRDVVRTEKGFYFEYHSECRSRVDPDKLTTNLLTYDIQVPYSLYHEHVSPDQERVIDLFFCTPVSDKISDRFMVVARNFAFDRPTDLFIDFTKMVWEQDRIIVETQRPEEVPLDWTEELHMRGPDGPSLAYRSKMRTFNVETVAETAES